MRIALPPAYTDAWFCKDANGHLQATGRDARGRKQYRYHPDYRSKRQDNRKYDDCLAFGQALPKLRARVERDLKKRKLGSRHGAGGRRPPARSRAHPRRQRGICASRTRASAPPRCAPAIFAHKGGKLKMRFPASTASSTTSPITDRNLKRVVRKCQDLPGQLLFQYVNGDGQPQPVTSADVNDYIRDATGGDFTAKHFRTWGASVIFFEQMLEKAEEQRLSLKTALEPVAEALGNTPAISRKSYVHPWLDRRAAGRSARSVARLCPATAPADACRSAETAFLAFLKKRSRRQASR